METLEKAGSDRRPAPRPGFAETDAICFSPLRWDAAQRPQHLLRRCARTRRVFFVEEPVYAEGPPRLEIRARGERLWIVVPHLPSGCPLVEVEPLQRALLDGLLAAQGLDRYLLWFCTPMAMGFADHLLPEAVIYDCLDGLSPPASPRLREREAELLQWASVVFTEGHCSSVARSRHPNLHALPSHGDLAPLRAAREELPEPADQAPIPHPRIGFCGALDERIDVELLAFVADQRPHWRLVMIGPMGMSDPTRLPQRPNIHYLGARSHTDLPRYIAGWDVAMLPIARGAARLLAPLQAPEYLTAGVPVASTPVREVVAPYAELGLVRVGEGPAAFVRALEQAWADGADPAWLPRVDAALSRLAWDDAWARAEALIQEAWDSPALRREHLPLGCYARAAEGGRANERWR